MKSDLPAANRPRTPEEDELHTKLAELAQLESLLVERELELASIHLELRAFGALYTSTLGVHFARIDELEAAIAEEVARQRPGDAEAARRAAEARTRADRSALAEDHPTPPVSSDALKAAYRTLAKRVHPDLAATEDQRARRHQWMAEANAAYAAGDLAALERLARSWDTAPDSVDGDSVVAQLVRAIRRISWIRQRLTAIDVEAEEAKSSELARLRARLDQPRWRRSRCAAADGERPQTQDRVTGARVARVASLRRLGVTPVSDDAKAALAAAAARALAPVDAALIARGHALVDRMEEERYLADLPRRAEEGDPEAQYELANELAAADMPADAEFWYRCAARAGHAMAQYELAQLLDVGSMNAMCGLNEPMPEAIRWLLAAAEQGHADAQFEVCDWEFEHSFSDRDRTAWMLRAAAEREHLLAQRALGGADWEWRNDRELGGAAVYEPEWLCRVFQHEDVSRVEVARIADEARAIGRDDAHRWLRRMCDWPAPAWRSLGPRERFHLALLADYAVAYDEAQNAQYAATVSRPDLTEGARQGHGPSALYMLAFSSAHVPDGIDMCRIAAGCGNTHAMMLLTDLVEFEESERWLARAATAGHPAAQFITGTGYARGEPGRPRDMRLAVEWWSKAGARGHSQAQYQVGRAYEFGLGVKPSPDSACYWYSLAAERGVTFAQFRLSEAHENGIGVTRSTERAAELRSEAMRKVDRVPKLG